MERTGKPGRGQPIREPIDVLIVCRAELLLLGLERLLAQAPGLRVFTYARIPDAATFESQTPTPGERPPLTLRGRTRVGLLCDRQLEDPVGDCERLLHSHVDEVVLLQSHPDVDVLLRCMGTGARCFVMEGDRPEVLLAAVRGAGQHNAYMGQRTLDLLVEWLASQERVGAAPARRGRDEQLLRLIAEGRSTTDIATRLGIAPKTVRNRLSQLYHRLGVRSRAAAVRLAEERGLLDPGERRH